jgi:hypothetical protein
VGTHVPPPGHRRHGSGPSGYCLRLRGCETITIHPPTVWSAMTAVAAFTPCNASRGYWAEVKAVTASPHSTPLARLPILNSLAWGQGFFFLFQPRRTKVRPHSHARTLSSPATRANLTSPSLSAPHPPLSHTFPKRPFVQLNSFSHPLHSPTHALCRRRACRVTENFALKACGKESYELARRG